MKSDFSHGRIGFIIQINDLRLIYVQYSITCFIFDAIHTQKPLVLNLVRTRSRTACCRVLTSSHHVIYRMCYGHSNGGSNNNPHIHRPLFYAPAHCGSKRKIQGLLLLALYSFEAVTRVTQSTLVCSCVLEYSCYNPKRRKLFPSITSPFFDFFEKFLD